MKKFLSFLTIACFFLSVAPLIASAACSPVALGGTGNCTFSSGTVVYGNGTSPLATTTAGTTGYLLQFNGSIPTWVSTTTLGISSFAWPFTVTNYGVSTSTTVGFTNGLLSQASSTFTSTLFLPSLGTPAGTFLAVNPSGQVIATTTPSGGSGTVTSVATTYPVTGGTFTTSGTIALAFGTTTANSWSQLQIMNGNASTTQLSSTNNAYLATGGGVLNVGTTTTYGDTLTVDDTSANTTLGSVVAISAPPSVSALAYDAFSGYLLSNSSSITNGAGAAVYLGAASSTLSVSSPTYAYFGGTRSGADYTGSLFVSPIKNGLSANPNLTLDAATGNATATGKWSFTNATSTLFTATTAWIGTLNLTNPLSIANGGTATSTGGVTNGVEYYNGTNLTNGSALTWNGSLLNVTGNASTTQISSTGNAYFATSGGNVGIGTTGPAAKLDVNGSLRSSGYTAPTSGAGVAMYYSSGDGYVTSYDWSGSAYQRLNFYGSAITFNTTGGEALRMTSTGNIGVGTSTPTTKLEVEGTASTSALVISTLTGVLIGNGTSAVTAASTLPIASGGTNAGSFTQSGGILAYDGTREVNFSGYTLTSSLLTATNASTTALTAGTYFAIPTSATCGGGGVGAFCFDTTNNQIQVATSTNAFPEAFDPRIRLTLSYSTTTAWAASSTLPAFPIPQAVTWTQISCTAVPNGATVNAQYQYANSSAYATVLPTMVAVTNTPSATTWSSSNTPTANATSTITFGTPAGSPTGASCTLVGTVNAT